MEGFVKGEVVILPFPFSDLSNSKRRPALIVATLKGNNLILCQITSQKKEDKDAIALNISDFEKGKLNLNSFILPDKIFTAEDSIVEYKTGILKKGKIREVQDKLCEIFTR
jgi:mRNA interferase MazF